MPLLSSSIKTLITNARFSAVDLERLRTAINSGKATTQDAEKIAKCFADTLEAGVGSWLRSLLLKLGSKINVEAPIANLASDTALLNGKIVLPDSDRKHPSVRNVQRALIALANRTSQLDYMLPEFGADGEYGDETTKAISNFQKYNKMPVTGKVDAKTASSLDAALRQTHVPGIMSATPQDIVDAAIELTTGDIALNYGVEKPWINVDPKHVVPAEKPFEELAGKWKCNLFGGNVLRKGGYEPPYDGNKGKGEYPLANEWQKWSDKYAKEYGNLVHFQLIDEVAVGKSPNNTIKKAIANLLSKVQPGDFVMLDRLGDSIDGHTLCATANNFKVNGTVSFAQSRYDKAKVQNEGVDQLIIDCERMWLLRPNRKM
ncbi:MAG: peptidoglycan-binding protein [Heteroscytonema crispum UTEX LB 1556]